MIFFCADFYDSVVIWCPRSNIIPLPYWQSVAPLFFVETLRDYLTLLNLLIWPSHTNKKKQIKTPTGPRRHPHNVPKWARFGETILWPRVAKQRGGGITRRRKFLSTSGRTARDHWRPRADFFRHVYFTVKGDFISLVCLLQLSSAVHGHRTGATISPWKVITCMWGGGAGLHLWKKIIPFR